VKYHVWTEGCQMNVADSQRVRSALERLGYAEVDRAEEADVIVLNTCVVRQSAEDRAIGRLTSLRPVKESRPDVVINLMGCMVGVKGNGALRRSLPYVDVFSPPSDPRPLVDFLLQRDSQDIEAREVARRHAAMDGDLVLPLEERGRAVAAHVPVVYGCSHACTFCIIPYRRGPDRSRPPAEIAAEARALTAQGVREITLLGQIVDRYGADVDGGLDLSRLLALLHDIDGLDRIRFLTSHPNWMSDRLLETVAELPKVCEHIEVPVQAGDDEVLARMQRRYRVDDYRRLIDRIRMRIPDVSIATDIIVGFPGESERQFQATYDLLAELRLDVAHLARYSNRPGTVAARRLEDDVSAEEKDRRLRLLEALQTEIAAAINAGLVGRTVEVLFEAGPAAPATRPERRARWKGRTRTNKLVFVDSPLDLRGRTLPVRVDWAGPWSLVGTPILQPALPDLAVAV
jgi:tRNA-2-methylthio-N6-dimethylallyladenosine synthase